MDINMMKKMLNEDGIQAVALTDKIPVGCSGCGNCCMNSQTRITPFDLYQISQVVSKEELVKNLDMYIGPNSGLPAATIKLKNGNCAYLKATNNGTFECKLKDKKPLVCEGPFIAVATELTKQAIHFVPLDQEMPELDIDKYLEDNKFENKTLAFMKDRNSYCGCKNKQDVVVEDYIANRIKYNDENNLASFLTLMLQMFVEPKKFFKLITLADNSSCNIADELFHDKEDAIFNFGRIFRGIFLHTYLFFDPDKPFKEQVIEEIKYVYNVSFPCIRILYECLLKVFDIDGTLENILKIDDADLAQEKFDNMYRANASIVMKNFIDILPELVEKSSKLKENKS